MNTEEEQKPQNPEAVKNFLKRYQMVIFVVVLVAMLIGCISILNSALTSPDNGNPTFLNNTTSNKVNFTQSTKAKLDKLQPSSSNSADSTLPSGRTNPFSE